MHPIRKQRLQIVLLIILAAACASGLVIYMLGQNTNYFYTPSQIQSGEAPQGVFVRAGGMVVDG
ncbi:MAG: cytochrome c maturation protein CcmE, partial [Porticoccaceae bacterium]|nr:cytochrome c maturation protein CcmE [Porticoccaceae bacterium]